MSSAYLRLLIFLPAILISACSSCSPAFHMYYTYKLNKQGENIQPWHTPFLIWNQSVVQCLILTVALWPAYRFIRRKVKWSDIPISWRIFHSLLLFTQSIPWKRRWQPTPVFLPGKSHGRQNLVGCSPWGHKESDTTERLPFHFSL